MHVWTMVSSDCWIISSKRQHRHHDEKIHVVKCSDESFVLCLMGGVAWREVVVFQMC